MLDTIQSDLATGDVIDRYCITSGMSTSFIFDINHIILFMLGTIQGDLATGDAIGGSCVAELAICFEVVDMCEVDHTCGGMVSTIMYMGSVDPVFGWIIT